MALPTGPYYATSSRPVEDMGPNSVHDSHGSLYPDLAQQTATDAQMYSLADNALQAHQNNSTSQFAGLIQAATAAACQDDGHTPDITGQPRRSTRRSQGMSYGLQSLEAEQNEQAQPHSTPLPQAHNDRKPKRAISGLEEEGDEGNPLLDDHQPTEVPSAPISQSASTLFRRPSSTNKKYTRPPMSKLFTSLELSPEGFLQLQSAAKNYMLNDAHPERRDTVGQRGKGDSELVKLRLWNCVKDFLENEGNGDRFFGPNVPGDEGKLRTMFWPSHKNNIITALTPLLRRMVTNERQRQYAVEARKPGATSDARSEKKSRLNIGQPTSGRDECGPSPNTPISGLELSLQHLFNELNGANLVEYNAWRGPQVDDLMKRILDTYPDIGLSSPEVVVLIAAIDYHLRITHSGNILGGYQCNTECETGLIQQVLETGYLDKLDWSNNIQARRERLREMLGDIFDLTINTMGDHLLVDADLTLQASENATSNPVPESTAECTALQAGVDELHHGSSLLPVTLHLNMMKEGKRCFPRVDVPADQYTDFEKIVQKIREQSGNDGLNSVRVEVWVPEGLVEVKDDAGWKGVLETVEGWDWMDGELKVLIHL